LEQLSNSLVASRRLLDPTRASFSSQSQCYGYNRPTVLVFVDLNVGQTYVML